MSLNLCHICLTSGDYALLRQRDLSTFYALSPSAFASTEDLLVWLCAFCWKRVSQCIHFIETAKRSNHVLTEIPTGGLLGSLKPTDLHPYEMRQLPALDINQYSAAIELNYPVINSESHSASCSRSSIDNDETDSVELGVAPTDVLPACQPVGNSPVCATKSDEKPLLVYTTSGYNLVIEPHTSMQVKQECAENLSSREVKQEPEFVKMEMGILEERRLKAERSETEWSIPAFDVPVSDAAIASGRPSKKYIFQYRDDPRFKRVPMSEEDMLSDREESRNKKFFNKRQFKCESCIIGFQNDDKYRRHMAMHHEKSGAFECSICRLRFLTQREQQCHTRNHYMTLECSDCGLRGSNRELMVRHYEEIHQDDIYQCAFCDERFRSRRMWRDHVANVHNKNRECRVCGKVLANTSNLKKHMMIHDDKFVGECPICHKTFRQLDQHMRIHSRVVDPEAYCAECDVQFKHVYTYRTHLRTSNKHTSPDFECAHCGIKCNTKNVLKCHIFTVHFKTLLSCPHCDKKIIGARRLRVHVRTVHEKNSQVKDKVCHVCARAFTTNVVLTNHMRRHTGERPFECKTCGDKFGFKAALYTHNKLKHLKLKRGQNKIKSNT